jgi:proline iminopeptidase
MRIALLSALSGAIAVLLLVTGCTWFHKTAGRETIFDRVVNIPKEFVLDIPYLPPLCDEIVGLKKGFAPINDGKLFYEEEGQGIPLILINSGPGNTHHGFHPYFSQAKEYAHIIYYDQRGTGQSSADDTGKTYTVKQAVEDLESLRKSLKIDQWVVLGWSFGGFLAQCYALTYPEHITGLILVAAGDGLKNVTLRPSREDMYLSKEEKSAIKKAYAALAHAQLTVMQTIYNAMLAGYWKKQCYYKPTSDELIRAVRHEYMPAPGFINLFEADKKAISLDGKFDDFKIPTLIVEGTWDLTWDTDKAAALQKNHPHAHVEVFKKSGHIIFADEPDKFFTLLQKFMADATNTTIVYKPGHRLTWPKKQQSKTRKASLDR